MSKVLQSVPAAKAFQNPMPVQVRCALKLLWLSLAISAVPFWWHMLPALVSPAPNGPAISGLVIPLLTLVLGICLNITIARRKNWARIMKLIGAVAGLLTMMFIWPFLGPYGSIKIAIAPALEFAALYLIFFTSGREWFRQPSTSKEV